MFRRKDSMIQAVETPLDAGHVVQGVPLHVPLHHPPGQGHLLAHREHERLAIAGRAAGCPPNTAHVLARVAGVVEEHHMVHVRKVDASRRPANHRIVLQH
jgi:hypothetical protein